MRRKPLLWFVIFVGLFALLAGNGCSNNSDNKGQDTEQLKGVFYDSPTQGVTYQSKSYSGVTNEEGEFFYRQGEKVTFSVGDLTLGSALGQAKLTPAHLVPEVAGDVGKITNRNVTNMARFLQSLDEDANVENGITITGEIENISTINFDQSEEAFTSDPDVVSLLEKIGKTLRTGPQARNHLRRGLLGIRKFTDVKIPMRDGSYVLADIYRPIDEGQYPAILNHGVYGKSFINGCICSDEDLLKKETLEDSYFEGNPFGLPYENHETAPTAEWVPAGYAVVRIDGRGTCNSPGVLDILSVQETEDFYDAIEWVARQTWSDGNVGLWGASYYAMNQWNVASLQPPSLKAMIPIAGDSDLYRETIYNGGIFNEGFVTNWWEHTYPLVCGPGVKVDKLELILNHPFYDPDDYGFMGSVFTGANLDRVAVPLLSEIPLSHTGHIHVSGASEGYIHAASKQKRAALVSGGFIGWSYTPEAISDHMRFFDYYLKGIDNGLMDDPPVKMMVRTGGGSYYWQYENEWPIARTEYTRYYLDAAPSTWGGDGLRSDFMKLSSVPPAAENAATYSAEVDAETDPCWAHGVSFVTEPLAENVLIAGYIKLVMWVSSTASDMDIFASLRVMDENDQEVAYATSPIGNYPVGLGWLKVSHRKLDPVRSNEYRPYHTHLESDYAPLTSNNEVVEVEVELWPTTALIKTGHRIRLDVQPYDGCDHGDKHAYDASYHTGAQNSIYTGPGHLCYLQLPVIPAKD